MPIWRFKTTGERDGASAMHQWYWQIDTDETPIAIMSSRMFTSLEECVSHAREHGFRGELDIPDTLTHPAIISCEEDDDKPGVGEPLGGRANRPPR